MISAGIKELKNNLSRYLSQVKKGDDVLITERGKVIARIIQEDPEYLSIREALNLLVKKGLLTFPGKKSRVNFQKPVKVKGKPVSEIVIEDRR